MTPLARRIAGLIEATGPIPVSDYMAMCLFDPAHGYYTTREPFGAAGDFTTAPEVSQMFGEMVAIWLYRQWQALGRPKNPVIAEMGPGRGTLMKDVLRTLRRLDPALVASASICLVEASPRLAEIQRTTLAGCGANPVWLAGFVDLPPGPLLFFANELLDCLPIRQFAKTRAGWRERLVTAGLDGDLAFTVGMTGLDPSLLPASGAHAPEGAILETSLAREALVDEIASRIASTGGAALLIDYGHLETGIGDTLQAMRAHAHIDALALPGESDLTSHVDFAPLAAIALRYCLSVGAGTQGDFLLAQGLLERAGSLGANKDATAQDRIRTDVERLAEPDQMGNLFKVLEISNAASAATAPTSGN